MEKNKIFLLVEYDLDAVYDRGYFTNRDEAEKVAAKLSDVDGNIFGIREIDCIDGEYDVSDVELTYKVIVRFSKWCMDRSKPWTKECGWATVQAMNRIVHADTPNVMINEIPEENIVTHSQWSDHINVVWHVPHYISKAEALDIAWDTLVTGGHIKNFI